MCAGRAAEAAKAKAVKVEDKDSSGRAGGGKAKKTKPNETCPCGSGKASGVAMEWATMLLCGLRHKDTCARMAAETAKAKADKAEDKDSSGGAGRGKAMKTKRNEKCPCGSGKKYKMCCIGSLLMRVTVPAGVSGGQAIRIQVPGKGLFAPTGQAGAVQ